MRDSVSETDSEDEFDGCTSTFGRLIRCDSFDNIKGWTKSVDDQCDMSICKILLGNKKDLEEPDKCIEEK